jgi:hypothetical protein
MTYLRNISLYLVMAILLNGLSCLLGSDFLNNFLEANIIIVLVSILAVNIAITSILIPKLKDTSDKFYADFSNTYREIKISFKEHILLIIASIMVMIIKHSQILHSKVECLGFISNTLLLAIFIYGIALLWDTGNAIFIITKEVKDNDNQ